MKYEVLALVLVASTALSYGHSAHDAPAARRFREVKATNPFIDRLRNQRWHTGGMWLRIGGVAMIGVIAGLLMHSWWAWALGTLVSGLLVILSFDIFFALKFGLAWWYIGTTSKMDELAEAHLHGLLPESGMVEALLETGALLVAVASYCIWV